MSSKPDSVDCFRLIFANFSCGIDSPMLKNMFSSSLISFRKVITIYNKTYPNKCSLEY